MLLFYTLSSFSAGLLFVCFVSDAVARRTQRQSFWINNNSAKVHLNILSPYKLIFHVPNWPSLIAKASLTSIPEGPSHLRLYVYREDVVALCRLFMTYNGQIFVLGDKLITTRPLKQLSATMHCFDIKSGRRTTVLPRDPGGA
jgi:hypothetical protein